MYICCVYTPTDGSSVSVIEGCYKKLKGGHAKVQTEGRTVVLGNLDARVGRTSDVDDVIGEEVCYVSEIRLASFLHEVDVMVGNGFLNLSGL